MELLGKAMDKGFWARVRKEEAYADLREELFAIWKADCENRTIEALTYSLFRLFWKTGDRSAYEGKYFRCRRAMNASALLALIYPEEAKYLDRLMDEIFAVCEAYTWCLPAHQPALDAENETSLDLFACETGFALSEMLTLLGDRMDPLVCARIRSQVEKRIIRSYCEGKAHYHWETNTANWAAVCAGSIGCTMMLMAPDRFRDVLPRIDATMACYLSGFAADGICAEGFSYWHYGFGFFTVYADMLRTFTGGERNYFADPKVKQAASFVQKMYVQDGVTVSFSDGERTGKFHLGLNHYLKNEYPDAVKTPDPAFSVSCDACGRWCTHLRAFTWRNPEWCRADPIGNETYYAENVQWLIRKTDTYGFAAKAGFNEEPHNHNDVGSFLFAKGGRQCLVDIGAAVYTRQYFSPERYNVCIDASSLGHSVPVIDGAGQQHGFERKSKNVRYEGGVFSFDMADAYEVKGLEHARRSFSFHGAVIVLEDKFAFSEGEAHTVTERFVTFDEPVWGEDSVRAGEAVLRFDPEGLAKSETVLSKTSHGHTLYMMDFTLKAGVREFRLEME